MADFALKRGDQLPSFIATLYDALGEPVDLTDATEAKLALRKVGSTVTIVDDLETHVQQLSGGLVGRTLRPTS